MLLINENNFFKWSSLISRDQQKFIEIFVKIVKKAVPIVDCIFFSRSGFAVVRILVRLNLIKMTDTRRRVKLYALNAERQWDDKGTGHVTSTYVERLKGMSLLVRAESDGKSFREKLFL